MKKEQNENVSKIPKIEAHHGMIVHKVLMTPLWRFTRLEKSFINIQEGHMVTLLAITKKFKSQPNWCRSISIVVYVL